MFDHDHARMERVLWHLHTHREARPSLAELATVAGLSRFHFQRLFRRWVGLSPHRFRHYLLLQDARRLLADETSVLDTSYATGLSGPGRLHDLFLTYECLTPGEFKRGAAGMAMGYGRAGSPFGGVALAWNERGVCGLAFVTEAEREAPLQRVTARWPRASWTRDDAGAADLAARIFRPAGTDPERPLHLLLRGTNFQVRVWEALLAVPPGEVVSYGALARAAGSPGAARAVGSALARNPIAYLIPCHRVIRSMGVPGDYQFGPERKRLLLAWEAARHEADAAAAQAGA